MQRVHALFILAWALVRSLVAGLLGLRRGLADFERSYAPDRLQPVSPADRTAMPTFGGCIACGLCDVGEGVRIASSRSMPDHDAALASFAATSDERLAELEARCPTRVPMRRIAVWVRGSVRAGERGSQRANVTRSPS